MKTAALVVVSLFAIQAVSSVPSPGLWDTVVDLTGGVADKITNFTNEVLDTIDNPWKPLDSLRVRLTNAADSGVAQLQQGINQLKKLGQEAVDAAKSEIKKGIDALTTQLTDFEKKASTLGDDVKACVSEHNEKSKNVTDKFVDDVVKCYTSKSDEADSLLSNQTQNIRDVLNATSSLLEKAKECGSIVNVSCHFKLTQEVLGHTLKIGSSVLYNFQKAITYVATLQSEITACTAKTVLKAGKEHEETISKIQTCFNETQA